MTAETSSGSDHRARARRQEILEAAAGLFAEKGYQRTAVKEVAERAGIAPGTIYLYFDSKGDLLIELMIRLAELEELDQEFTEALQGDARAFLSTIFRERMGQAVAHEDMVRAIMPQMLVQPALREQFYEQYVEPLTELLEQYVETRIEQGNLRPVNVPLTVRAVQSMFFGLLILRILDDEVLHARWDEMPEVVSTLLFDGLSPVRSANGGAC